MYFGDIFRRLLRCFAFQSHIQSKWTKQHGKIIIQEAQAVIQYSGSYVILLTSRFRPELVHFSLF